MQRQLCALRQIFEVYDNLKYNYQHNYQIYAYHFLFLFSPLTYTIFNINFISFFLFAYAEFCFDMFYFFGRLVAPVVQHRP